MLWLKLPVTFIFWGKILHEGKFSQDIEKVSGPLPSYIGHGEFHLVERVIQEVF